MISFWVRSKFRVMNPRRYYIGGEPVDCLGAYSNLEDIAKETIKQSTVRNQVRNTAHASLSYQLRRCLSLSREQSSCHSVDIN